MGLTLSGIPQDIWAVKKQEYHPTHHDIRAVRYYMRRYLPTELVNIILDYACYWSLVRVRTTYNGRYLSLNASWSIDNDGALCVLLSPKLNTLTTSASIHVRRLSFRIASHDQGWSPLAEQQSASMYQDSFTWFEAIIVRGSVYDFVENEDEDENQQILQRCDDSTIHRDISAAVSTRTHDKIAKVITAKARQQCPLLPPEPAINNDQDKLGEFSDAWHIQTNIRGSRHTMVHTVSWERELDSGVHEVEHYNRTGGTLGRGFIAELQREDRIAVVARAKSLASVLLLEAQVLEARRRGFEKNPRIVPVNMIDDILTLSVVPRLG